MSLEDFQKEFGSFTLFPGSLNELQTISASRIELFPFLSIEGKKYLTGILIPTREEIETRVQLELRDVNAPNLSKIFQRLGLSRGEDGEITEAIRASVPDIVEGTVRAFEEPYLVTQDIRYKTREIGANGLIRFGMFSADGLYMGIPIVRR